MGARHSGDSKAGIPTGAIGGGEAVYGKGNCRYAVVVADEHKMLRCAPRNGTPYVPGCQVLVNSVVELSPHGERSDKEKYALVRVHGMLGYIRHKHLVAIPNEPCLVAQNKRLATVAFWVLHKKLGIPPLPCSRVVGHLCWEMIPHWLLPGHGETYKDVCCRRYTLEAAARRNPTQSVSVCRRKELAKNLNHWKATFSQRYGRGPRALDVWTDPTVTTMYEEYERVGRARQLDGKDSLPDAEQKRRRLLCRQLKQWMAEYQEAHNHVPSKKRLLAVPGISDLYREYLSLTGKPDPTLLPHYHNQYLEQQPQRTPAGASSSSAASAAAAAPTQPPPPPPPQQQQQQPSQPAAPAVEEEASLSSSPSPPPPPLLPPQQREGEAEQQQPSQCAPPPAPRRLPAAAMVASLNLSAAACASPVGSHGDGESAALAISYSSCGVSVPLSSPRGDAPARSSVLERRRRRCAASASTSASAAAAAADSADSPPPLLQEFAVDADEDDDEEDEDDIVTSLPGGVVTFDRAAAAAAASAAAASSSAGVSGGGGGGSTADVGAVARLSLRRGAVRRGSSGGYSQQTDGADTSPSSSPTIMLHGGVLFQAGTPPPTQTA